jgi:hypothetical protein
LLCATIIRFTWLWSKTNRFSRFDRILETMPRTDWWILRGNCCGCAEEGNASLRGEDNSVEDRNTCSSCDGTDTSRTHHRFPPTWFPHSQCLSRSIWMRPRQNRKWFRAGCLSLLFRSACAP